MTARNQERRVMPAFHTLQSMTDRGCGTSLEPAFWRAPLLELSAAVRRGGLLVAAGVLIRTPAMTAAGDSRRYHQSGRKRFFWPFTGKPC